MLMKTKKISLALTLVACLCLFATSCTPNNTADEDALYEQNIDILKIKVPKRGIDILKVKVPKRG